MRYLTKEWYNLCQKQDLHFDMRVHKGAAQKNEALYLRLRKRKERAFIEMERGVYDCDPRSMFEMDGAEFVSAEKWTASGCHFRSL